MNTPPARKKKPRTSDFLTDYEVKNLAEAATYAFYQLSPLNRHVTIHCELAGVSLEDVHRFRKSFLKLIGDWLRLRDIPICFLWVLENPLGGGLNLHVLLHLPPEHALPFARHQRSWLRAAGGSWKPKAIKTDPVGPKHWLDDPPKYTRAIDGMVRYLLKGATPETCDFLSTRDAKLIHVYQGHIIGKRAGVSEATGPKARSEARIVDNHGRPIRMSPMVLTSFERQPGYRPSKPNLRRSPRS